MAEIAAPAAWRLSGGRSSVRLAFAALALLYLCPVLLVDIPAMVDYPNHLARMSILMRDGTPAASRSYDVVWALYPNLAMDLVVPPLARWIGVEPATKLFYVAGQILIVGGAVAIAAARRRPALASGLAALAVLYGVPFAWGFVNFEFALGLGLFGIAAWLALEEGRPGARFAIHAGMTAALFVAHLFALGIYGVTIAICEAWRLRRDRAGPGRWLAAFGAMVAPPLAMAAILVAVPGGVGGDRTAWEFPSKLFWIFGLNGWSRELSIALGVPLIALAYVLAREGCLRLLGPGRWLAIGFALLFAAMPFRLFDTAFVDVRVLVAAALILPAFVAARIPPGRLRAVAIGIVGGVLVLNLLASAYVQAIYRADYRAVIASFDLLRRSSHVLVADSGDAADPPANLLDYPMQNVVTLAAHYADAHVPTLFATPGKQPIRIRPEWRAIDVPEGGLVPIAMLREAAGGRTASLPRFVAAWPHDFDYLYVLGPPAGNPMPDLLEELTSSRRFTLFRIRKAAPP